MALFTHAIAAAPGSLYVDVLDRQTTFTDALPRLGFSLERPYTRMRRGGDALFGDPARTYLIAGPELG